jgi:23S rRNA pseudouridine1911/1915/1917 synthase
VLAAAFVGSSLRALVGAGSGPRARHPDADGDLFHGEVHGEAGYTHASAPSTRGYPAGVDAERPRERTDRTGGRRPAAPAGSRRVAGAAGLAGQRLDVALARALDVSRAEARRLLAAGSVRTREQPGEVERVARLAEKGRPLGDAEVLQIEGFVRPEAQRADPEPALALRVLDRGHGWIAVDKPAGMPVHPLRPGERRTALGFVAALHPEVHGVGEGGLRSGVVHRLDVDTSGALLFATEPSSWQRLRGAFAEHRVAKTYRAIVSGELRHATTQRLGLGVSRHRPAHVRVIEDPTDRRDVRIAEQRVEPIEALHGATLVEVRPVTGFLHQIRVTLAHIGHPILGDSTYAPPEIASASARQLLHAARVGFEEIEAHAPDPGDFSAAVERLRA